MHVSKVYNVVFEIYISVNYYNNQVKKNHPSLQMATLYVCVSVCVCVW